MKALIGTKLGMTTVINEDGRARAVTVVQAGPVTVTQVREQEKDGYSAVQVGFGSGVKPLKKPQAGHVKASQIIAPVLKEFKNESEVAVGDSFNVSAFVVGDVVKVRGISKGKGFSGTIKRHNFMRQRKSHGAKGHTRRPGSIGSMYPQKVFRGKRMAGRMGHDNVSVRNLEIAFVDEQQHLIGVFGAIPGPKKGVVTVEGL